VKRVIVVIAATSKPSFLPCWEKEKEEEKRAANKIHGSGGAEKILKKGDNPMAGGWVVSSFEGGGGKDAKEKEERASRGRGKEREYGKFSHVCFSKKGGRRPSEKKEVDRFDRMK